MARHPVRPRFRPRRQPHPELLSHFRVDVRLDDVVAGQDQSGLNREKASYHSRRVIVKLFRGQAGEYGGRLDSREDGRKTTLKLRLRHGTKYLGGRGKFLRRNQQKIVHCSSFNVHLSLWNCVAPAMTNEH
jgi:hypothetical protein